MRIIRNIIEWHHGFIALAIGYMTRDPPVKDTSTSTPAKEPPISQQHSPLLLPLLIRLPRRKGESPDSVELGKLKEELRLLKVVHQSALKHTEKQNKTMKLKDHDLDEAKRKLDRALNDDGATRRRRLSSVC